MADPLKITLCIFIIIILTNLTTQQPKSAKELKTQTIHSCDNAIPDKHVTCNGKVMHSTCIDGNCTCPVGAFQNKDKCQVKPGEHCSNSSEAIACGPEAICSEQGLCECKPPNKYHDGRLCFEDFVEPCTTDKDCVENLSCLDKICKCGNDSVYTLGQCRKLVGSRCNVSIDDECVSFANCTQDEVCQCSEGTVMSIERTCRKGHRGTCDHRVACADFRGLVCRKGFCFCRANFSTYYEGACIGVVAGADCGKKVEYTVSEDSMDNITITTVDEKTTSRLCYRKEGSPLKLICLLNNTCVSAPRESTPAPTKYSGSDVCIGLSLRRWTVLGFGILILHIFVQTIYIN